MKVLLDTDICIYIIKRSPAAILERFAGYEVGDLGLSSITVAELAFGVDKSRHVEQNRRALQQFLLPLTVAPFDHRAALTYGRVRAGLEASGLPIGPLDTLIGAHAVALDVALATHNVREFSRIPELRIERWGD
ncbi:MAG: type II toxin-antitoxin system VapC family toxin [Acidobacteriota bacterium]